MWGAYWMSGGHIEYFGTGRNADSARAAIVHGFKLKVKENTGDKVTEEEIRTIMDEAAVFEIVPGKCMIDFNPDRWV